MRTLSICSGVGGLDLGIRIAVPDARAVCYIEREAYAAAVLAARMEDGTMDQAPIVLDLREFDGSPWRGEVDCIAAGFPCQPVSLAGKGLAQEDERWLWDDVARVIREVEPRFVFVENVPGLVRRGLRGVVGDLAELGFDAEWSLFSAAASGAPHLRKRLFLLASHPDSERPQIRQGIAGNPRQEQPAAIGTDWWVTEPDVGRVAHGIPHRVDRLRAIGNGVVPIVAARAWITLMGRLVR